MMYRYLETSVSWRIPRKVIQQVKLRAFERRILTRHIDDESEAGKQVSWQKFTIWGAGRDGKNFLNQLQPVRGVTCSMRMLFTNGGQYWQTVVKLFVARSNSCLKYVAFAMWTRPRYREAITTLGTVVAPWGCLWVSNTQLRAPSKPTCNICCADRLIPTLPLSFQ